MVDGIETIRNAQTEDELRTTYARWMSAHAEDAPSQLRMARKAFRDTRTTLASERTDADVDERVRDWLRDWRDPAYTGDDLEARLWRLPRVGLSDATGGPSKLLLQARRDWFALIEAWPGPPGWLALLERRLLTTGPTSAVQWPSDPESRRLARWVRDRHPAVLACAPAFFERHLPAPTPDPVPTGAGSASGVMSASTPAPVKNVGLSSVPVWVWVVAFALLIPRIAMDAVEKREDDRRRRTAVEREQSDEATPWTPGVLPGAERPDGELRAAQVLAMKPNVTEVEILAHLSTYQRGESSLRLELASGLGMQPPELGDAYRKLLRRLDDLRDDR